MDVLGIDGARGGWVGVAWDGTTARPLWAATLAELCTSAGPVDAIAVDMPIVLSDRGPRPCDVAARPLLGARRASLFAPPVAAALLHDSYAAANAWSKASVGHGISKQAWMLVPKILEVRALESTRRFPLYETFPELSFRAMNGDVPLTHAKRTWTGTASRLRLLSEAGIELPEDAGPAGSVAADDLIDAAALAWSAARIAAGRAERLPASGEPGEAVIWW